MTDPVTIKEALEWRRENSPIPTDRGFTDDRVQEIAERQSDLYAEIGAQLKEIERLDAKLHRIAKGALE